MPYTKAAVYKYFIHSNYPFKRNSADQIGVSRNKQFMYTVMHGSALHVETDMKHLSGKSKTPAAAFSEQGIRTWTSWVKLCFLPVKWPCTDSF